MNQKSDYLHNNEIIRTTRSQFVTAPQTVDVWAVCEALCNTAYPPGDARLGDTANPGDLPEAVAVLDIHGHQQFVRAAK
jgi:hypothetical protein